MVIQFVDRTSQQAEGREVAAVIDLDAGERKRGERILGRGKDVFQTVDVFMISQWVWNASCIRSLETSYGGRLFTKTRPY